MEYLDADEIEMDAAADCAVATDEMASDMQRLMLMA